MPASQCQSVAIPFRASGIAACIENKDTAETIALLSPMIVQAGRASRPRSEDAALILLLRALSTTAFMRVAFHWIVSLSLPMKRQTHTFSSFCEKTTPLRAAAIPRLVLSSTGTAFIARLEKLNDWNRLKLIGMPAISESRQLVLPV
jgi:hypothetical protein